MRSSVKIVALMSLSALGTGALAWAAAIGVDALLFAQTRDPSVPVAPPLLAALIGITAAIFGATALRHANEWMPDLPVQSYLFRTMAWTGVAVGAATAIVSVPWLELPVVIGAAVVAVAAAALTVVHTLRLRQEIIATRAERIRIAALKDHGRRVRASVTEAESTGIWVGGLLLFHVTAEYDSRSGHHVVYERVLAGIADAPIVGGTVLLWVAADDSAPTDVLLELDPDSIRHPDPSVLLPIPEPKIRGFRGADADPDAR